MTSAIASSNAPGTQERSISGQSGTHAPTAPPTAQTDVATELSGFQGLSLTASDTPQLPLDVAIAAASGISRSRDDVKGASSSKAPASLPDIRPYSFDYVPEPEKYWTTEINQRFDKNLQPFKNENVVIEKLEELMKNGPTDKVIAAEIMAFEKSLNKCEGVIFRRFYSVLINFFYYETSDPLWRLKGWLSGILKLIVMQNIDVKKFTVEINSLSPLCLVHLCADSEVIDILCEFRKGLKHFSSSEKEKFTALVRNANDETSKAKLDKFNKKAQITVQKFFEFYERCTGQDVKEYFVKSLLEAIAFDHLAI